LIPPDREALLLATVSRMERPHDNGLRMIEERWRKMLGEQLATVSSSFRCEPLRLLAQQENIPVCTVFCPQRRLSLLAARSPTYH